MAYLWPFSSFKVADLANFNRYFGQFLIFISGNPGKATFASGVKNEKLREYEYRYGKSDKNHLVKTIPSWCIITKKFFKKLEFHTKFFKCLHRVIKLEYSLESTIKPVILYFSLTSL
jgi:hypothetical protein